MWELGVTEDVRQSEWLKEKAASDAFHAPLRFSWPRPSLIPATAVVTGSVKLLTTFTLVQPASASSCL